MSIMVPDISTAVVITVTTPSTPFDFPLTIADDVVEAVDFGAANSLQLTAHGFVTGDGPIRVTTTTTVPAGLALATDYWVIRLSADLISLATTRALAIAGTAIDLTSAGTGTHTIDVTASSRTMQSTKQDFGKGVAFEYVSETASWITQSTLANVTATLTAGSMYVPANKSVTLDPARGRYFAAIRNAADGKASFTRMKYEH